MPKRKLRRFAGYILILLAALIALSGASLAYTGLGEQLYPAASEAEARSIADVYGGVFLRYSNGLGVLSFDNARLATSSASSATAASAAAGYVALPALEPNVTLSWIPEGEQEAQESAVEQSAVGTDFRVLVCDDAKASFYTEGEPDVLVAVIDSGINAEHAALSGKVAGWKDFTGGGEQHSANNHGTHVAGIIAARSDVMCGAAPGVSLLNLRILDASGNGSLESMYQAVVYAVENGADVINLSLGSVAYYDVLQLAVNYAYSSGVPVFCASGNSGVAAPLYPAGCEHAFCVGALDATGCAKASYSNYGGAMDIAAPGTNIYSTSADGGYVYLSGTSMATPVVSAAAALLLTQRRDLYAIRHDASATAAQKQDVVETICGLLQTGADDMGNQAYFGAGRLNVFAAMRAGVLKSGALIETKAFEAGGAKLSALERSSPDTEDVLLLRQWLIMGEKITPLLRATADVNADGALDMSDVQTLTKMYLNQ